MSDPSAVHAGNFADVLKHAVLIYALDHLAKKDKPFTVIETHAGRGVYDLTGERASVEPSWREGVGRIMADTPPPEALALLGPYRAAVEAVQAGSEAQGAGAAQSLSAYPGSTGLIAKALRADDRAHAFELDPQDAGRLARVYGATSGLRIEHADGYDGLKRLTPPTPRRGLVLVDPSFEHVDEMYFMARAARDGLERWSTATYIFWRPLTDLWAAERFDVGLTEWLLVEREASPESVLRADLWVREIGQDGPLAGAGALIVNPPFGLDAALLGALPYLVEVLAQGPDAGWRLDGGFAQDSLSTDAF